MTQKPFAAQTAYEDTGIVLMARVVDSNRNNIVQADVAGVEITVWDLDDTTTPVATVNPTVASVIFDTLQDSSNSAWTLDTIGCNFIYKTLAAHLAAGGKTYRFQVRLTMNVGSPIVFAYHVPTVEVYGS